MNLEASSSALSLLISFLRVSTDPEASSLIEALFFIILARYANFKVDNVSLNEVEEGLMFAIIIVFEFPPRESLSRKVSLESLYLT